ncbi:hypothetical protein EDO6_02034 [Paenibacillus xylanexedens]|nr:hypothetical protein EDO6_02034 [Paenibacillus xylanexedens]
MSAYKEEDPHEAMETFTNLNTFVPVGEQLKQQKMNNPYDALNNIP